MKLQIFKEAGGRIPRKKLRELFESIVEEEAEPGGGARVNLVITDNRNIRRLNRHYRRVDRITDVLSFNIDSEAEPDGTFGEVYISSAVAERQAGENKIAFSEEIVRLFCHGLLHLFGYDHIRKADRRVMRTREENCLRQLYGGRQP